MKPAAGSLFALVGVVLIGMTGFGAFLPIFRSWRSGGRNAHGTTIAMGAYSLGQLISSPLWAAIRTASGASRC